MFYRSISIRKTTFILIRLNEFIPKVTMCMTMSFDYLCKILVVDIMTSICYILPNMALEVCDN